MRESREHAGERTRIVRHLVRPHGDTHGPVRFQIAVRVHHQPAHLRAQSLQGVSREGPASMDLQALVDAAHAAASAAGQD